MKNLLNIALVACVLIVLGCKCQQALDEMKNQSQSPSPTASASPSPSSTKSDSSKSDSSKTNTDKSDSDKSDSSSGSGVSKASYDKIKIGMKKSEIIKIIGDDGEEMTRSKGGGSTFTSHKWEGSDYAIITAVFKDDVLTNKYEANLK